MKNSSNLAESKLVIIYLLHKTYLPVSISYIQDFVLDNYMDYFSLSNNIAELTENGYIVKNIQNNKTTFKLSEKGYKMLNLFKNLIPVHIKENIDIYIENNKIQLKKELDIIANYNQIDKNEFNIKCIAYENASPLIEINFKVTNKKYARTICENWKKNASKYYISFIKSMLESEE